MRILENDEWDSSMTVEGYTPAKPEDRAEPYMNQISPGYFATLGVPIVAGRDFRMTDDHEIKKGPEDDDWTPTTVMINEKFAKKFFPGRNPLGLHLGFGSDPGTRMDMEIIGIEGHQVHQSAGRGSGAGLRPVHGEPFSGQYDGVHPDRG